MAEAARIAAATIARSSVRSRAIGESVSVTAVEDVIPPKSPVTNTAAPLAQQFVGEVADVREDRDHHHHPPDLNGLNACHGPIAGLGRIGSTTTVISTAAASR